jgi:hypothetical protein
VGPAYGGLRPLRLDDRAPVRNGRAPARLSRDVEGAADRLVSQADSQRGRRQRAAQPVLTRRVPSPARAGPGRDGGLLGLGRSSESSSGQPPIRGDEGGPKASRCRSYARRARSSVGSRSSDKAEASRTSLGLKPMSASSRRFMLASVRIVARAAATRKGQAAARVAPTKIDRHIRLSEVMVHVLSWLKIGPWGLSRQRQFNTVTPNCTNPLTVQFG